MSWRKISLSAQVSNAVAGEQLSVSDSPSIHLLLGDALMYENSLEAGAPG